MKKRPDGMIDSPAGMLGYLAPRMLPMAQVIEKELHRRREYEQLPDVVKRFFNPRRRHSTLGYLSPIEFEHKAKRA